MTSSSAFIVAALQYSCSKNIQDNLYKATAFIEESAKLGAQVICLPELFNSRYFCTTEDHSNFSLAMEIESPAILTLQKLAKTLKVVLVVPFFERRASGLFHNSAAVIDADGSLLGVYRKMHIPDDPLYLEKFYFTPGDADNYQVFKTRYANVGVLICWDQWYPEAARITALKGADVILYPTAIGWHPAEKKEWGQSQLESWRTIQRSHAIANGIFVVATNRVGFEDTSGTGGIEFFGNSFICDPYGRYQKEATLEEEILLHSCDKKLIEQARTHWPFLRDRRIDSYAPILKRFID